MCDVCVLGVCVCFFFRECSPMAGLKTIFKAQNKDSLEGELPSDDAYLLAQDSESSRISPLQEDDEALAMLQESLR